MVNECIKVNQAWSNHLIAKHSDYYSLDLTLSSQTDWAIKGKESCLVEILLSLNGQKYACYHVVTYMGERLFNYSINLGFLQEGIYSISIRNMETSVCEESDVFIHSISMNPLQLSAEMELVYEHTPILYGRNHFTEFDPCFTDTPLAMLYSLQKHHDGMLQIDYEVIFSHEDEGTPGKLLMSKWGRSTDIEWCYTVKLNPVTNEVIERTYQGSNHENRIFNGDFKFNRPILQARTTNGNFDHIIDSRYCFSMHPSIHWDKEREPREWFMKEHKAINYVMIKEAERQLLNHPEPENRIDHPTNYTYVFFFTNAGNSQSVIDLVYEQEDGIYICSSNDFYNPTFGYGTYTGGYPNFTIAMNIQEDLIPNLKIRLLKGESIVIHKVEFCTLDAEGNFREVFTVKGPLMIDSDKKWLPIRELIINEKN